MDSVLMIGVTDPSSFGQFVVESIATQLHRFKRVAVYLDTSRPITDRKKQQLSHFEQLGIDIVAADGYSSGTPFRGFGCVMSFLGNHALQLQPGIIDLAIEAGVRHFYPSEYGADIMVGQNRVQRYYHYKMAAREHLEQRALNTPDLGWTLFLLGRLTEWAVIPHFGIDNSKATARIYGTSEGRQSLISARDAAAYIVRTLLSPLDMTRTNGYRRTFRISGSSPTYSDFFEALKIATGKEYQVTYLDIADAVEEEMEAKARGDIDAELSANHKLIQGMQGTLLPKPWDNERFPELGPPTPVDQALKEAFQSPMFRAAYGLSGQ